MTSTRAVFAHPQVMFETLPTLWPKNPVGTSPTWPILEGFFVSKVLHVPCQGLLQHPTVAAHAILKLEGLMLNPGRQGGSGAKGVLAHAVRRKAGIFLGVTHIFIVYGGTCAPVP